MPAPPRCLEPPVERVDPVRGPPRCLEPPVERVDPGRGPPRCLEPPVGSWTRAEGRRAAWSRRWGAWTRAEGRRAVRVQAPRRCGRWADEGSTSTATLGMVVSLSSAPSAYGIECRSAPLPSHPPCQFRIYTLPIPKPEPQIDRPHSESETMEEAAHSVPPVDPLVKETPELSLSSPLSPPTPRPSSPPPSTASLTAARTIPIFEGDVLLGYVDVFLPPGTPTPSSGVFPSNDIRISRRSPASNRCPPLAVLQVISAYSMRCKLRENTHHPRSLLLATLHSTCWNQRRTAVVDAGAEELHLVAMQSKDKGVPSFWCWSAQAGLYVACLGMLNQRCLAIVFDLDQTLVSCYNESMFKSLVKKIESCLENNPQLDAAAQSALRDQLGKVSEDHIFLKDYVEKRAITVHHETVRSQDEKSMLHKPGGLRQVILRPVIRVPTRNAVLTCLDPMDPGSSYFVNIRPGWDDLKSYLITTSGCRRYKVYVCTRAGRCYALEAWRLLDPEGRLISLEDISQRLTCVRSDSQKSLLRVFRKSLCHPNLAMVIDDRIDVWDEKDKPRVHNLPAYHPSVAPEDKVVHGPSVLQTVRSITRKVHQGFFSEFDGILLKIVDELMYENDVMDLPYPPDVGDYLQQKKNKIVRHSGATISSKNTSRAEVESGSGEVHLIKATAKGN